MIHTDWSTVLVLLILFKNVFIFVLSLRCCTTGAAFCCGVHASHCSSFSCYRAQALEGPGSVDVAQGLSCSMSCEILPTCVP